MYDYAYICYDEIMRKTMKYEKAFRSHECKLNYWFRQNRFFDEWEMVKSSSRYNHKMQSMAYIRCGFCCSRLWPIMQLIRYVKHFFLDWNNRFCVSFLFFFGWLPFLILAMSATFIHRKTLPLVVFVWNRRFNRRPTTIYGFEIIKYHTYNASTKNKTKISLCRKRSCQAASFFFILLFLFFRMCEWYFRTSLSLINLQSAVLFLILCHRHMFFKSVAHSSSFSFLHFVYSIRIHTQYRIIHEYA